MSISSGDFEVVQAMVLAQAGIVLTAGKEYLVEARLAPVAKKNGFGGIDELIASVRGQGGMWLVPQIVDAMTTNETTFFRDVTPFDLLRTTLLPRLIEARRPQRRLAIWHAASSTGQEPYSVAMLMRDHFPELQNWDVKQLATDISSQALERARLGRYSELEVSRGLPPLYLARFFRRDGLDWQIADDIKRMVTFDELNLIRPLPAIGPFDIVMLRNVLIYFSVETKRQILARVRSVLKPDGYLFLGSAETTMNIDDAWVRPSQDRSGCYQPRLEARGAQV